MRKVQTSLLALALLGIGVYWIYVRVGESEPEVIRNALVCPDCGQKLPQKDAPCLYCLAKKNREQGKPAPEGSTKQDSIDAGSVIIAVGLSGALLAFAFWPRIQRLWQPRDQADDILVFRCPQCSRKLRYQASRAGMPGKCPTCKTACTFPEADCETA